MLTKSDLIFFPQLYKESGIVKTWKTDPIKFQLNWEKISKGFKHKCRREKKGPSNGCPIFSFNENSF